MRPARSTAALLLLAVILAACAQPASAAGRDGRCRVPAEASVVHRTASVVVFTRSNFSDAGTDDTEVVGVFGCVRSQGERFRIGGYVDGFDSRSTLERVVANGRFAAVAIQFGGRSQRGLTMTSVDLRTGRRARGLQVDGDLEMADRLGGFAVGTSGDLGWSIDRFSPGRAVDGGQEGRGFRGEVHVLDARGDVLLDAGPEGAFGDVRVFGRVVSWRVADGTRRSAPLQRP